MLDDGGVVVMAVSCEPTVSGFGGDGGWFVGGGDEVGCDERFLNVSVGVS